MRPKAVSTVEERFYLRFIEDMWNIPRAFAGHGYGNHICFCSNSPKVLCKLPYDHNAISVACCVFRISFLQPRKSKLTIQGIFFGKSLCTEIDILPVPTDEAARQLQSTLLGVETNVANWQRRQNANNNFTATIPYDMELQRKETKEISFIRVLCTR